MVIGGIQCLTWVFNGYQGFAMVNGVSNGYRVFPMVIRGFQWLSRVQYLPHDNKKLWQTAYTKYFCDRAFIHYTLVALYSPLRLDGCLEKHHS